MLGGLSGQVSGPQIDIPRLSRPAALRPMQAAPCPAHKRYGLRKDEGLRGRGTLGHEMARAQDMLGRPQGEIPGIRASAGRSEAAGPPDRAGLVASGVVP